MRSFFQCKPQVPPPPRAGLYTSIVLPCADSNWSTILKLVGFPDWVLVYSHSGTRVCKSRVIITQPDKNWNNSRIDNQFVKLYISKEQFCRFQDKDLFQENNFPDDDLFHKSAIVEYGQKYIVLITPPQWSGYLTKYVHFLNRSSNAIIIHTVCIFFQFKK